MLTVERKETAVEVKFTVPVPTTAGFVYALKWEAGHIDYAGFVAGAINNVLAERTKQERIVWYEKGWRDAKSKKVPKRTWFPRSWKWPG